MNPSQIKSKPNFLRLIDTKSLADPISHDTFVRQEWQSTLFANENPSLLLFVNFEEIGESDFITILTSARPKFLFDLRKVPRFDLGGLNRKQAFSLFSRTKIRYLDLSREIKSDSAMGEFDAALAAKLIINASHAAFVEGPAAFLVDGQQFDERNISRLIEELPSERSTPWDVLRVPVSDNLVQQAPSRSVVFINHANPEDNAFATWLAGQLALAGYSVWSDITQLVGGEVIWDDIESTIRLRAAKVIAVLSTSAQRKPGVLDELDLAIRVERSVGLSRFVLPVRLDDLSYSEVRANIARRNIIDFRDNWATGLHALLTALERDRVPRSTSQNAGALGRWVTDRLAQSSSLVDTPEKLISNWLPIASLPEHVFLHDLSVPVEQISAIGQTIRKPTFRYLRLLGTFATAEDLQSEVSPEIVVSCRYRIRFDDFLAGRAVDLPGLPRWEARKFSVNLLRQAWNIQMKRHGLRSFEMASGYYAWYLPKGLAENDRVEFTDDDGKRRRKMLVGWSERRKVFWHFAVEARPILGESPHYLLRQHVIFTPDGSVPVESKERMHLLRRRFCKNWWNDRWRDLLIAYVTWLTGQNGGALSVGSNSNIQVDKNLMTLASPFSISRDEDLGAAIESEDELDTDDDWDSLDQVSENEQDDGDSSIQA